jgi:hypothetical protein
MYTESRAHVCVCVCTHAHKNAREGGGITLVEVFKLAVSMHIQYVQLFNVWIMSYNSGKFQSSGNKRIYHSFIS